MVPTMPEITAKILCSPPSPQKVEEAGAGTGMEFPVLRRQKLGVLAAAGVPLTRRGLTPWGPRGTKVVMAWVLDQLLTAEAVVAPMQQARMGYREAAELGAEV